MNHSKESIPLAYFITFTTYGTWLHGAKVEGSVDRQHNVFSTPTLSLNSARTLSMQTRMKYKYFLLDAHSREIVLNAIKEVCAHRQWDLLAAHVRTNHVHIVVHAEITPEIIINTFKAYSSRYINQSFLHKQKYWTRHGSTRYLWKEEQVEATIDYVVREQGEPMAVFENVERILVNAI